MTTDRTHDPLTVVSIAVLAATLAAVCHETLGHGAACLANGGRITLLTSIEFRCDGGSALVDFAGPLGNLAAGGIAAAWLSLLRGGQGTRFFLTIFATYNLLWFFGQLIHDAASGAGDIAFAARQAEMAPIWPAVAVVIGIAGYGAAMRWAGREFRNQVVTKRIIRTGYAAALVSALVAALAWLAEPLAGAGQALLTFALAPIGLLAMGVPTSAGRHGPDRSWRWIAGAVLFFAIFVAVQGHGIGSLAANGLPPQ